MVSSACTEGGVWFVPLFWYGMAMVWFGTIPMVWYVRMLHYGVVDRLLASLAPNLHAPLHLRGWYGTDWQGNKIQRKTQIQMQIGIHIAFTSTNERELLGEIHD